MLVQRPLYALVLHWGYGWCGLPWLGAALAKTDRIVVGTGVTAPILRHNHAVVAQVFATLGYMFPCRDLSWAWAR